MGKSILALILAIIAGTLIVAVIEEACKEKSYSIHNIALYCGHTYKIDVSPLRTRVECRGEEFVILPNVRNMSDQEFEAYQEAADNIPIGMKPRGAR